jgi:hypothetical protein
VRVDMLTLRKSDNTVIAATQGRGLFTANFDISTGIEKIQGPKFTIYPNPTTGIFTISDNSSVNGNGMIRIYDQTGKVVAEDHMNNGSAVNETRIDLSGQAKGIYYVELTQDGKKGSTVKIVVD